MGTKPFKVEKFTFGKRMDFLKPIILLSILTLANANKNNDLVEEFVRTAVRGAGWQIGTEVCRSLGLLGSLILFLALGAFYFCYRSYKQSREARSRRGRQRRESVYD